MECTFGSLKARFRFLKNPIRVHNEEDIECALRTAAVLHNMLLFADGFVNENIEWEKIDPEVAETEGEQAVPQEADTDATQDIPVPETTQVLPLQSSEIELTAHTPVEEDGYIPWNAFAFTQLRKGLIKHLTYQYSI